MQETQYVAFASRSGRYWLDVMPMSFADFKRAMTVCRRCRDDGYVCWHIVRLRDGLVIAQSRNAKV